MDTPAALRSWSTLSEEERLELICAYQPVLDCEGPTCSFGLKLRRMQAWLKTRGASITEAEIRGKRGGLEGRRPATADNSH